MVFTLQINPRSIPRIALAGSLFLLSSALGQTIGLDSILGPGWAGREQTKPISSNIREAPIALTPGEYATSAGLSLGASLVPAAFATYLISQDKVGMSAVGLIAASLIIGPSTGQFVYGFSGHGYLATTVRLGAIAASLGVLGASFESCDDAFFSDSERNCSKGFDPTYGLVATGAFYLGGFLYSLIQPAFAIHHEPARTVLPIEVLPRLSYDAQGLSTLGLVAGWRF